MPFGDEEMRGRDAREMRLGAGAVGDVDRRRHALQGKRAGNKGGGIGGDRRRELGRDDEAAACDRARQRAGVRMRFLSC